MRSVVAILQAVVLLVGLKQSSSTATIIIDLSSKNLSFVPSDLPKSAEYVDLSLNRIHQLRRQDFNNTPNLKFLNLSWNSLEEIDPQVFSGTPFLENLDLSHNSLQNLSDQKYLFYAEKLQVLNLAFNRFFNMTLGNEFKILVMLKKLAIGGNNIQMEDFINIAGVKLLTLTLCLEKKLTYVAGSLKDVQANRLEIALSNSQIIVELYDLVGEALLLFKELQLTGLTSGYRSLAEQLSRKGEIHTSCLYLTNISIDWIDLTYYINIILQSTIANLTTSDVSIFKLPILDTDVSNTSAVRSFTIRRAVVTSFIFSQKSVYNFFINMPVASMAILETSIIHMTCPKSQSLIAKLDFSNCAMSDTIFSRQEGLDTLECKNLSKLNKLLLKGNNLKNLQILSKRVQYMRSLQFLDLSLNALTYESQAECVWPPNITYMNLSSNGLTHSVFKCLPGGIKILDLQNNQISVLPQESILKLDSLIALDLSSNRLRDVPTCDSFPTLAMLLVRANSLHAPSVSNLESCPKLKRLDVSHNPFICTCVLRSFRTLGIESEWENGKGRIQLLNWPADYYCSYPEDLRNFTLKDFWIPEISCNIGLLASAILGPMIIVLITVITLCQHLDVPWYMGMIWQWTRAKHRAKANQIQPQDTLGVEFHAFVSYSQHDAEWVKDSLLPNLHAGGLHICHHEESFMPGKTIVENIICCVEKSWRCVFVLSSHFVKSEWCHYELYFASHQHLSWGSDRVVLVLLEPLPQYLIPSKYHQLKNLISRHTYLEWPKDKAKHRLFWANLRAALQADLPDAPAGELEE